VPDAPPTLPLAPDAPPTLPLAPAAPSGPLVSAPVSAAMAASASPAGVSELHEHKSSIDHAAAQ